MSTVSTADIKELREKTGAGMMDCKKALAENNSNMEEAIDWLRKKGIASAAKKATRAAAEGLVAVATNKNKGVIIELNSETDFVARNDKFQGLALNIANIALENTSDLEALKALDVPGTGRNVEGEIAELISVIGENMNLRRTAEVNGDIIVSYIHNAVAEGLGKIGIIVALKSDGDEEKVKELGKQVAMHVAASKPESLDVDGLDQTLVERERNVLTEQAKASGKPDEVIAKMIEGRIRKFYAEVVLLEQPFVMDGKTAVKQVLKDAEKDIGAPVTITGYARLTLGEGVDKKDEDFAAEVAAAANG
ncbi:translation elongation factor Ts [Rickettsiales bacterium]|nr:translation elongation factor Ts [Rickettsiales bacterium]